MRVIIILVCVYSFALCSVDAQSVIPPQTRAEFTLTRFTESDGIKIGDMLYGLPGPSGSVIGDTYLTDDWSKSKIQLYEKEKIIAGFPIKYDIKGEILEVKSGNEVKVLHASKVKTLVILDPSTNTERYFVNAIDFRLDGAPLSGFLEVMTDGTTPLLKQTYIFEKEPDYNAALNVGSRDVKILKKERFFYSKGRQLSKIQGKKSLSGAFGEHSDDMTDYIKSNKLSTDDQADLVKIFDHYNSKLKETAN
jgi:hypothetical protein